MTKKSNLRICIIIPARNEATVIKNVIRTIFKEFKSSPYTCDIIVINDGSTDLTEIEAKKAGAIVINHILNTGPGGATLTGLRYASNKYEIAATMDADGQHDPKDVINGIKHILAGDTDVLIGSRLIDAKGMSRTKIIGNRGLTLITALLFGVASTDSQSGLRIFSRNAIEKLCWKAEGYEFCSEMLWRAKQLHLKTSEYPIRAIYTAYSTSTRAGSGQNNWNGVNIVKNLLKRRIMELLG